MFVERSGEVVEMGTRVHADGEVAGIIMGDLVKTGHVEGDVIAGRRHAEFEFGAMPAGNEGEFFVGRELNYRGDFFGGGRFHDGRGNDFIDSVLSADGTIDREVMGSKCVFQARDEV